MSMKVYLLILKSYLTQNRQGIEPCEVWAIKNVKLHFNINISWNVYISICMYR